MAVMVALSWSSISISSTGLLSGLRDSWVARPAARLTLMVDFPTPPLRLIRDIIAMDASSFVCAV